MFIRIKLYLIINIYETNPSFKKYYEIIVIVFSLWSLICENNSYLYFSILNI